MLNERLGAAQHVAARLFALEAAIDEAIACAGALAAAVPEARKRAKLSAMIGQAAFAHTGKTLAVLIDARAQALAAHEAFSETQEQMGLKAYAMGDLWKLPKPSATAAPLELVSSHAA